MPMPAEVHALRVQQTLHAKQAHGDAEHRQNGDVG